MADEVADALDDEDRQPPAKFMFMGHGANGQPKWLSFPCPGKLGKSHPETRCMISLRPQKNDTGASWDWDGNRERPTITPSVNCKDCWHGWIRNGEFLNA